MKPSLVTQTPPFLKFTRQVLSQSQFRSQISHKREMPLFEICVSVIKLYVDSGTFTGHFKPRSMVKHDRPFPNFLKLV